MVKCIARNEALRMEKRFYSLIIANTLLLKFGTKISASVMGKSFKLLKNKRDPTMENNLNIATNNVNTITI